MYCRPQIFTLELLEVIRKIRIFTTRLLEDFEVQHFGESTPFETLKTVHSM